MILQQLTEKELHSFDQMSRTSPEFQMLVDYLVRCINMGAITSCYSGGEEKHKISGAVIAFRDLAALLLSAKTANDEVSKALINEKIIAGRDMITP